MTVTNIKLMKTFVDKRRFLRNSHLPFNTESEFRVHYILFETSFRHFSFKLFNFLLVSRNKKFYDLGIRFFVVQDNE